MRTKCCKCSYEMLCVCVVQEDLCFLVASLSQYAMKGKMNTYTKYVWYNANLQPITYSNADIVACMVVDKRMVLVLLKRSMLVLCRIT
jgi:hypothetical protein